MLLQDRCRKLSYPWEMRREEFVKWQDTLPETGNTRMQAIDLAEDELHRVLKASQKDAKPQIVRQHEMGQWVLDDADILSQYHDMRTEWTGGAA